MICACSCSIKTLIGLLALIQFHLPYFAIGSCVNDEIPMPPALPNFFEYVPIRKLASNKKHAIRKEELRLLQHFSDIESTCGCNATKRNIIYVENARRCPRSSHKIIIDTQHCVRDSTIDDLDLPTWTTSAEFTSSDSMSHVTRGGDRRPGVIDPRLIRNTTSITPMTSRHATSNINLHILIGIVVIATILIIILFGSMVWWMRKRTDPPSPPFSTDCKRWFRWCEWSKKDIPLRNASDPFNNPVFCVNPEADGECTRSNTYGAELNDCPHLGPQCSCGLLDLDNVQYPGYRPLRLEYMVRSANEVEEYSDDSSLGTESMVVTPTTPCSFVTFSLDNNRLSTLSTASNIPLKPLETDV